MPPGAPGGGESYRRRRHPWTCTPIASQVKTNTSPGRPKAVGIRQPRNSPPIANNNSDAHERDGPKVDNDILHPHSAPGPASAGAGRGWRYYRGAIPAVP